MSVKVAWGGGLSLIKRGVVAGSRYVGKRIMLFQFQPIFQILYFILE